MGARESVAAEMAATSVTELAGTGIRYSGCYRLAGSDTNKSESDKKMLPLCRVSSKPSYLSE